MKLSIKKLFLALSGVLWILTISAQECVNFYFEESMGGGELVVDLRVENFENITTTQLAIAYSDSHLSLNQITGNSDLNIQSFNFNTQSPGYIVFSWSNPVTAQTLADGTSLIEMRFDIVDGSPSNILIDDSYDTELADETFSLICYTLNSLILNDDRPVILGSVLHDTDANCMEDMLDIPLSGWKVKMTSLTHIYYAFTNGSGNYSLPVELGEYTVEVLPINDLWTPCVASQNITATTENENYDASFVITPDEEAPALVVSVNTDQVIVCANNQYFVSFKNNGSTTSIATKIDIVFDPDLSFVESNFGSITINDQTVTANIGTLEPGDEGKFRVTMFADCGVSDNQAICAHATIDADNSTVIPNSWVGAVLSTEAQCIGDSVQYTITNIGDLDVLSPLGFIVVEDDVMFQNNDVSLDPLEDLQFKVEDNGGAHRIIVNQESGYPYGENSTAFIPSCNDDNGSFEFISMFANEDASPLWDVECDGATSSFISNSKTAYPIGYRDDHKIEANQDIEYTINFQNTTDDTVFQVVIEDALDPSLNIESLLGGSSSHPYVMSVDENRNLRFTFYGLLLPNSITDAANSSGFVSYKISQNADLPAGTIIGSDAKITFDGIENLSTNVFSHEIGENYVEMILDDKTILLDNQLITSPNPTAQLMKIEVPSGLERVSYVIYNSIGSVVNAANCPTNVFYIHRGLIPEGMYTLEIRSNNRPVGTKKIIFQE